MKRACPGTATKLMVDKLRTFPVHRIKIFLSFIKSIVSSNKENEDLKRQEFILNTILTGLIFLFTAINLSVAYKLIVADENFDKSEVVSPLLSLGFLIFFCFLLFLSKKGKAKTSSAILIATMYLMVTFLNITWGIELIAAIMFSVLIIVISGILINARFAFFAALTISASDIVLQILNKNRLIKPDIRWHSDLFDIQDVIVLSIIFIIIAILSWLSNREIDASLKRARTSEAALLKERNLLEIKVEEKTKELKELQLRELAQFHRLAEFGKLSAGLFHELANPLTALNLNIEEINEGCKNGLSLTAFGENLNKATKATKKIGHFIASIKKQVSAQDENCSFSLNKEIEEAMDIMIFKARENKVRLEFFANEEIFINGNSLKFHQIVANLISNAIDSYRGLAEKTDKSVRITLRRNKNKIILTVTDRGCGIKDDLKEKIFEAFFTTKDFHHGTGLGLAIIKNLAEKSFNGKIYAETRRDGGMRFIFVIGI